MIDQLIGGQIIIAICAVLGIDTGVICLAIWFVYTKLKEKLNDMGQATTDKINELKTAFGDLGTAIAKEIQQLKDAGVINTDDPAALTALDGLIAQAKGFKSDLDADDPVVAPPATP